MFIEKLFGNTFGLIWLIVFLLAVLALIVWLLVKKEKKIVIDSDEVIDEPVMEDEQEDEFTSEVYEIVTGEDGFYRVKRIGESKTLRKFAKEEDAETYIKEKENVKEETVEDKTTLSNVYEIVAGEDGFYRVRKRGTERTLRKFSAEEEAIKFIKEKETI